MSNTSVAPETRTVPEATSGRVLRGLALYEERGAEIVAKPSGGFSVPSATDEGRSYRVNLASGKCGCLDYRKTRKPCLHVYAATIARAKRTV